jgi:hypothetical protein
LSMDDKQYKGLRRAFSDIARGYSCIWVKNKRVFLKHLSNNDYADLDLLQEEFYRNAVSRGLPTREEHAKFIEESGEFDIAKADIKLAQLKADIEFEKSSKDKQSLKSRADENQRKIDELKYEYNSLFSQKEKFFTGTCEYSAERELSNQYLKASLFHDSDLKEPYWKDDEFDFVDNQEIYNISESYSDCLRSVSDEQSQILALSDLGMNNWYVAGKNSYNLFGCSVAFMTSPQFRLCANLGNFSSILENTKNIPPHIRYDPAKLLDFANIQNNSKELVNQNADAISIHGATREDYAAMGINEDNSIFAEDIVAKAIEKKGGSKILGMDEMRNLFGP